MSHLVSLIKRPHMKKKVFFHQDHLLCHRSMKTMIKIHELQLEMFLRNRIHSDEDDIAERKIILQERYEIITKALEILYQY